MNTYFAKQEPNVVECRENKVLLNNVFTKEREKRLQPIPDKTVKCNQAHTIMFKIFSRHTHLIILNLINLIIFNYTLYLSKSHTLSRCGLQKNLWNTWL